MNKPYIMKEYPKIILVLLLAISAFSLTVCACRAFHHPSATGMATVAVPVLFDDPSDIMYWPSIDELQWFARTKPDGLFRRQSQEDYEARRWEWYCDVSARATWPIEEPTP